MLALIIPLTLAAIIQGFALSKIGIVPLFWIIGGALATVGCGLFYTMDDNTSIRKWIGYQIIVGFAVGWTFQVAISNVIDAYMVGLRAVFAITIASFGVATFVGFFGSWKKLHGESLKKSTEGGAA